MTWLLFSSSHFALHNNTLQLEMVITTLFGTLPGDVRQSIKETTLVYVMWVGCVEDSISSLPSIHFPSFNLNFG